ncbi:MAG: 7-carboxy-7-deazaguanine synthase QueE [Candidatus Saliniplasma sp.]
MKIVEIFYSLQGEGTQIGLPTIFIRTSGCNLRCEWCDTEYAWEGGEEYTTHEIMKKISNYPVQRVCLTGGEPLIQDEINTLIEELTNQYDLSIETNGSKDIKDLSKMDLHISMDYKTPSSGMCEYMREENIEFLRPSDVLKFVIADSQDYIFAKNIIDRLKPQSEIVFQPVHGVNLKDLAEWVIEDGLDVRVIPQLHKLIWGDKKGV